MSFWASPNSRYRLILCDVWGVVHDGVRLYPRAAERLKQWREEGRCVALLTNAPRTAEAVERQLARIGLPRDAYQLSVKYGGLRDPAGAFIGFDASPRSTKNFLHYTLQRLRVDHIDIYRPARLDFDAMPKLELLGGPQHHDAVFDRTSDALTTIYSDAYGRKQPTKLCL